VQRAAIRLARSGREPEDDVPSENPWLDRSCEEEKPMNWSKPDVVQVNMSAEVGGYEGDREGDDDPRFVRPEASAPNDAVVPSSVRDPSSA
jgi:hypothetical protein